MSALFGWQGFSFEHPDDWAPVALSGDRSSGYARLASARHVSLQVRWDASERNDLDVVLDRYLERLARDARRKRRPFSRAVKDQRYRYRGDLDGDGALLPTHDGRIAFLEAVGDSTTARTRALELALDTFEAEGFERWSVLGLNFCLPGPLKVERKAFVSGRTALTLAGRGVRVEAERWGLAESLLARTSLLEWAQGRMGRGWTFREEGQGLRGSRKALLGHDEGLVLHQPGQNQITLVRARARKAHWRPEWDWLS